MHIGDVLGYETSGNVYTRVYPIVHTSWAVFGAGHGSAHWVYLHRDCGVSDMPYGKLIFTHFNAKYRNVAAKIVGNNVTPAFKVTGVDAPTVGLTAELEIVKVFKAADYNMANTHQNNLYYVWFRALEAVGGRCNREHFTGTTAGKLAALIKEREVADRNRLRRHGRRKQVPRNR